MSNFYPGTEVIYSFDLATDTRLHFDSLSNSTQTYWYLRGPAGFEVGFRTFAASDSLGLVYDSPVLDLVAGTYYLYVGSFNPQAIYAFRLLDLDDGQGVEPGEEVSGSLKLGNESVIYIFKASAGDTYYFDVQNGTVDATWSLVDPYSNILFRQDFALLR